MLSYKSRKYEVFVLNLSNLCACIFYYNVYNSKVEAFQLKYEGGTQESINY